MAIETSYDSKYGSGDRRNFITISHDEKIKPDTDTSSSFVPERLVDGSKTDTFRFLAELNGEIYLDFKSKIFIDEFKVFGQGANRIHMNCYANVNGELVFLGELNHSKQTISFDMIKTNKLILRSTLRTYTGAAEFEFKTYLPPRKTLIKKGNQYGYYTDSFQSLGTSYPTKEQIEQYGMSDLSILEAGDIPVEYEMELISETDEEKCFSYSFDLNGQHKNMKSIDGIITE